MKYFILTVLIMVGAVIWAQRPRADITPFLENELALQKSPVVVELFTSQSCSSCPPADAVLAQLGASETVIALGFHVDYWNHLSWEDTLSQKFSTDRQRSYAAFRKSRRVYTPQMVVNGDQEFVGSDVDALKRAVRSSRTLENVDLQIENGVLYMKMPGAARVINPPLKFWLFGTKSSHEQAIASGENRGLHVAYSNAVLVEKDLGMRAGDVRLIEAPLPVSPEVDLWVVLVQENGYGPIVAAGQIER